MITPAVDSASPDADKCALAPQVLLKLAEDAKQRASMCKKMKEVCDEDGEIYPDYVLKDRAAPVSSRRTDARRRR